VVQNIKGSSVCIKGTSEFQFSYVLVVRVAKRAFAIKQVPTVVGIDILLEILENIARCAHMTFTTKQDPINNFEKCETLILKL
jgi:hypothetical protein